LRTEVYARVRNGPESKLIPSISSGLSARVTRRPWEDSTQNKAIHLVIMALLCWQCAAAGGPGIATIQTRDLIRGIPPRPGDALTGSDFVAYVSKLDPRQREMAIREEILKGNLPDFLRKLVPVELRYTSPGNRAITATIFVMPDYLAIGSDDNCLRIPMNLYSATSIANRLGFVLPTKKMVDAIYESAHHLVPEPLPAGPRMRSTEYYWIHNQMIERQEHRLGIRLGDLVSGHKKDVVLTNRLREKEGRIAIYGWHRHVGDPIQPLSTVHGAAYADYSHGIRLISALAIVDGQIRSIDEVLRDPRQAGVLSSEGPMDRLLWIPVPEDPSLSKASALQMTGPRQ
jgi:hypothetical protein